MILNPPDTGLRLWQSFKCDTRLILQVNGAGTFFIARDQSEIQNPNDGIQLTQANTGGTVSQPLTLVWQGSFWYRVSAPGTSLIVIVIGKVGAEAKDAGARGI